MADKTLINPHDSFFKEIFSRPEHARDFLQHYLPPDIVAVLDLASLTINKDTFIDPELQPHFSDLLYEVKLVDQASAYIYLLFEHKSYAEPLIAFQLLRYMTRIWEQALKEKQALVPIVPLVLYHGRSRWSISPHFRDLFELPDVLRPYLPDYRYEVYDLSQYDEAEIKGEIILQVVLRLLKYILRSEINERLSDTLALLLKLSEQETALQYLQTFLRYVSQGAPQLTEASLQAAVSNLFREGEALMPTLVEQWMERGEAKGLQKGKAIGREEGREATIKILRRFLAMSFNLDLDHFDADLARLDLEAIIKLSDQAFEVKSLAEFEAALTELQTEMAAKTKADEPSDSSRDDDNPIPESDSNTP